MRLGVVQDQDVAAPKFRKKLGSNPFHKALCVCGRKHGGQNNPPRHSYRANQGEALLVLIHWHLFFELGATFDLCVIARHRTMHSGFVEKDQAASWNPSDDP